MERVSDGWEIFVSINALVLRSYFARTVLVLYRVARLAGHFHTLRLHDVEFNIPSVSGSFCYHF